jgi:hypothetical protein
MPTRPLRQTMRWHYQAVLCSFAIASLAPLQCVGAEGNQDTAKTVLVKKQLIGPTATVEEAESDLEFKARVDTGATTSSLHVEEWIIEDEAAEMSGNVGKTIRIKLRNHLKESEWIKRKIIDISTIKTSEREEDRYMVRMTLRLNDVKKRVLVSLNDRSHMNYAALLGRNFLRDDFVVDVSLKSRPVGSTSRSDKKPSLRQPTEPLLEKDAR